MHWTTSEVMPCLTGQEQADDFLHADEQERRGQWIHDCQKMTQNAINLASQATRALTIGDWSRQDCEEFLDDLEKEFKKVNKELDTYPLVDCEPGVKRKMADCRLRLEAARYEAERVSQDYSGIMMPGARCHEKAGRERKSRRLGQSSGATGMRSNPRSVLKACGWRGTAQAQEDRKKRDLGPLGASRRKGPPRVRR